MTPYFLTGIPINHAKGYKEGNISIDQKSRFTCRRPNSFSFSDPWLESLKQLYFMDRAKLPGPPHSKELFIIYCFKITALKSNNSMLPKYKKRNQSSTLFAVKLNPLNAIWEKPILKSWISISQFVNWRKNLPNRESGWIKKGENKLQAKKFCRSCQSGRKGPYIL